SLCVGLCLCGSSAFATPTADAPQLTMMNIGDSITHGANEATNYRKPLWEALNAAGYNIKTVGFQNSFYGGGSSTAAWGWHCGQTGATIMPSGGSRVAQRLSLDAELEVCGYPDIITLLIGTNDVDQNVGTADEIFAEWVEYVDRIATLRPHSKILDSTFLKQNAEATTEKNVKNLAVNAKIAVANGATKALPFTHSNVTLVDLDAVLAKGATDFADTLHPNATGYEKLATAWSTAIQLVLNKETGLMGNRVPVRAFNVGSALKVTFNKPFIASESLSASTVAATIAGTGIGGTTLTYSSVSDDKRTVTFTASAALPTAIDLTVTFTALPGAGANAAITFQALGSGAAENVPEAFRNGFSHRKTLTIGTTSNFGGNAPTYADGAGST
ncbi:MAG: GDSL-type esterase/lipase family protein, partial [Kiritimatiellia bacterium]